MRTLLLTLSLTLLCSPQAFGMTLRVVTEQWPPYNYVENGAPAGMATEIIRAVLDRSGLDYSIEVLPWARAYALARNEPEVLIYSILKLPERDRFFKWVRLDGLDVRIDLYRSKFRRDIRVVTLDDAKAYRVGLTRDSAPHHFLLGRGFVEGVNLFPVSDEQLNLRKSQPQNDRIDLTTGDPLSQAYRLRLAGLPADYWVRLLHLFSTPLYMAFSRSTPDALVERVRRALHDIREAGTLDAVVAKYHRLLEP